MVGLSSCTMIPPLLVVLLLTAFASHSSQISFFMNTAFGCHPQVDSQNSNTNECLNMNTNTRFGRLRITTCVRKCWITLASWWGNISFVILTCLQTFRPRNISFMYQFKVNYMYYKYKSIYVRIKVQGQANWETQREANSVCVSPTWGSSGDWASPPAPWLLYCKGDFWTLSLLFVISFTLCCTGSIWEKGENERAGRLQIFTTTQHSPHWCFSSHGYRRIFSRCLPPHFVPHSVPISEQLMG